MTPRFVLRRIPPDLMDRLRMATAVSAEQVLEEHVESAVELVEEGSDWAPVDRLLSIYGRLHHLVDADTRKLRERVLAVLGRNGGGAARLEGPRSPLSRIVQRVRGRVNPELRDYVERHTARVELTVVDIHVHHALEVVRLLEEHLATGVAITIYADMMNLRPTVAEIVRLKTLKVLHDRRTASVEPLRPEGPVPLRRRAENGG
jgi:hypothetical protein